MNDMSEGYVTDLGIEEADKLARLAMNILLIGCVIYRVVEPSEGCIYYLFTPDNGKERDHFFMVDWEDPEGAGQIFFVVSGDYYVPVDVQWGKEAEIEIVAMPG